jgi:hypothetical protein
MKERKRKRAQISTTDSIASLSLQSRCIALAYDILIQLLYSKTRDFKKASLNRAQNSHPACSIYHFVVRRPLLAAFHCLISFTTQPEPFQPRSFPSRSPLKPFSQTPARGAVADTRCLQWHPMRLLISQQTLFCSRSRRVMSCQRGWLDL